MGRGFWPPGTKQHADLTVCIHFSVGKIMVKGKKQTSCLEAVQNREQSGPQGSFVLLSPLRLLWRSQLTPAKPALKMPRNAHFSLGCSPQTQTLAGLGLQAG